MAEQCREPPDRRGGNSMSYPGWMLGPDDLGETRILLMRAKPKPDKKGEERLPSKPFMIAQTIQLTVGSKIRPYYPSPMICFRCAEYGHGKNKCPTENPVCLKCSKMHTLEENETCQNDPYCLHCQGNHFPMARDCPKYKEEAAIIKLKVDQGLSFGEARTIFRDSMRNTTFKSIVQQRLSTEVDEKDRTIQILREELAAVKNELRKLQETVTQKSNMVSTDMIRSKQSSNKTRSSSPRALSISPTTDSIMKPSGSDKTTEQSPRLSRIDSKGSYTSNRSYQQKANPQHNRNLSKKRTTTPPKLNAKKGKTNGPPLSCGPSPMEQ
ncbi:uncharacterized protein LOC129758460 [Uranotaenia lowii]|uniref:uncharacterized protein LOC129758460 n=1 Tax=Uranotaenia lowii TaxID=190385 RepID=UPI0024788ED5|nr:uncharacterized protein LOC129758460 [Uranotaenia lowii]